MDSPQIQGSRPDRSSDPCSAIRTRRPVNGVNVLSAGLCSDTVACRSRGPRRRSRNRRNRGQPTRRSDRARPFESSSGSGFLLDKWVRRQAASARPRPAARLPRFRHPDVRSDRRLRQRQIEKNANPRWPPSRNLISARQLENAALSIPASGSQRANLATSNTLYK